MRARSKVTKDMSFRELAATAHVWAAGKGHKLDTFTTTRSNEETGERVGIARCKICGKSVTIASNSDAPPMIGEAIVQKCIDPNQMTLTF